MERGPLPPHERTWRHPSELAAQERAEVRAQAAAPSTRVFALTTGTLGLLAVGILILTVTPRPQGSPTAISATTTPGVAVSIDRVPASVRPNALSGPVAPAFAGRPTVTVGVALPPVPESHALATPFGDGHLAIVTRAALDAATRDLGEVLLPSGRIVAVQIVDASDDVVIVALADVQPAHEIADHRPHDQDIVTVMASPPITVAFGDIDTVEVGEGTAVLDGNGDLVGVCSGGAADAPTELIEVTADASAFDDRSSSAAVETIDSIVVDVSDVIDAATSADR